MLNVPKFWAEMCWETYTHFNQHIFHFLASSCLLHALVRLNNCLTRYGRQKSSRIGMATNRFHAIQQSQSTSEITGDYRRLLEIWKHYWTNTCIIWHWEILSLDFHCYSQISQSVSEAPMQSVSFKYQHFYNNYILAKVLKKGSWTCVYSSLRCLSLHFLLPYGQGTSHAKDKVQL